MMANTLRSRAIRALLVLLLLSSMLSLSEAIGQVPESTRQKQAKLIQITFCKALQRTGFGWIDLHKKYGFRLHDFEKLIASEKVNHLYAKYNRSLYHPEQGPTKAANTLACCEVQLLSKAQIKPTHLRQLKSRFGYIWKVKWGFHEDWPSCYVFLSAEDIRLLPITLFDHE